MHSNDGKLIVGDQHNVRLWRWNGKTYEDPRVLCEHRCSFQIQQVHVHPRLTPDSKSVLFTTDMTGYANLYLAPIPEFTSLPVGEK
jgi:oligogalacturonide lyase